MPQEVESVSLDTVPLSLTIVLDTSGSMEGERLKDLIEAAQTLVKSLRDQDAAALITFAESVQFKVPVTHDRERLLASLTGLVAAGFTSLNDAAFLAMQLRPIETADSRPVVLVFSDGHDNTSWLSAAQLLEATRRSRMLTHVVELVGRIDRHASIAPRTSSATRVGRRRPSLDRAELARLARPVRQGAQRAALALPADLHAEGCRARGLA